MFQFNVALHSSQKIANFKLLILAAQKWPLLASPEGGPDDNIMKCAQPQPLNNIQY
jgi:hypothetical protein